MDSEFLDALWKSRHKCEDFADLGRLLDSYARETQDLDARTELDWRRARWHHFAAMQCGAAGDKKAARAHFERGANLAQWTLDDGRIEGRFWWAVNYLEAGRLGGSWPSYWALRGAKPHLETVAGMDETFHFAAPLRVLGRIAHLAPPRLGGGVAAGRNYFERALEIADNSTTRLYCGELLAASGDETGARAQFEAILDAPEDENWKWEQARDRISAAQHLGR